MRSPIIKCAKKMVNHNINLSRRVTKEEPVPKRFRWQNNGDSRRWILLGLLIFMHMWIKVHSAPDETVAKMINNDTSTGTQTKYSPASELFAQEDSWYLVPQQERKRQTGTDCELRMEGRQGFLELVLKKDCDEDKVPILCLCFLFFILF